ncbi:MAG TPA: SIR2 family protein [Rhodocyclaceae bacterium]
MTSQSIERLAATLVAGKLAPYLGPELLLLEAANAWLPVRPETLAERLAKRSAVPGRLRRNLTAAAQYIENFRHRRVLRGLVREVFTDRALPTRLHHLLAALPLPLVVDVGYDAAMAAALAEHRDPSEWGQVQAVSRADEKADVWTQHYAAGGERVDPRAGRGWRTLLYKPFGSILPEANFLVSDSDFVEVLTEIDIQTPIPENVQLRRSSLGFLFVGCRFDNQLARTYARQVSKRSSGPHFAVMQGELTANEARFLAEQGIQRIDMATADFVLQLGAAIEKALIAGAKRNQEAVAPVAM